MADQARKIYFSSKVFINSGAFRLAGWLVQRLMGVVSMIMMPIFWAKIEVRAPKDLPLGKPLLILANHKSYYDPLVVSNALFKYGDIFPIRFFSKDKLFFHWYSSWFYALSGAFPAFYKQGLEKSLAVPKQILGSRGVVVMFPEGRCVREDILGEFKVGASVLAQEVSGLWVLPVAIHDSYRIKWRFLFGLPKVKVTIGEPFQLEESLRLSDLDEITIKFTSKISSLFIS